MQLGRVKFVLFLLLIVCAMSGCAIGSTVKISDAEEAVAAAKAANAEQLAPYEYYSAVEYLKKADEIWGHSKHGTSYSYAKKAIEFANAAIEKAQNDPWVSPIANISENK